jgi:carbon-monoxide dehydrogenase medium subunit
MYRVLKPFEFLDPKTIDEANQILSTYGNSAKVLAGGVDLVARIRRRLVQPKYVVSILNIPELDYIEGDKAGLKIGALTTLRSIECSLPVQENYAVLYQAVYQIASVQVKAMGTAVGNLCVATPASDVAVALMSLAAKLRIAGYHSERIIPIDNFFIGVNQTILKPGEIVTEILVPGHTLKTGSAFARMVRTAADVSKVNVAVTTTMISGRFEETRIALGAVAPKVIRATKAEGILNGQRPGKEVIAEAALAAIEEIEPITDIRSTAEYRKEMVKVLVRQAIVKASQG